MPIPLIVGAIVAGGALIGTKTGRSIVKGRSEERRVGKECRR